MTTKLSTINIFFLKKKEKEINKNMLNVFVFHRDLRLVDHRPLQYCLSLGLPVLPLFVLTPQQTDRNIAIRSIKSLACLFQSLEELDTALRSRHNTPLCVVYGNDVSILEKIHQQYTIHTIVETRDYTPFALKRQQQTSDWCEKNNMQHELIDDLYFFPPGTIRNQSGKIFQKFTPFYKIISKKEIPKPLGHVRGTFFQLDASFYTPLLQLYHHSSDGHWKEEERKYQGGRKEGLRLLKQLPYHYDHLKHFENHSGLSVHHHYGTISVRESYARAEQLIRTKHALLKEFQRQLFWRDYYANIMCFFNELYHTDPLSFQLPLKLSKRKQEIFQQWCDGKTGVAIIDDAMHRLNREGFMPNRMRLITASWLVKDMGVPWRYGERYFANHLLDYDLTQNMMNWIWVASVLPFASAPFRRFSTNMNINDGSW